MLQYRHHGCYPPVPTPPLQVLRYRHHRFKSFGITTPTEWVKSGGGVSMGGAILETLNPVSKQRSPVRSRRNPNNNTT
ncbi:unnamed protein product [Boreogadus saida]